MPATMDDWSGACDQIKRTLSYWDRFRDLKHRFIGHADIEFNRAILNRNRVQSLLSIGGIHIQFSIFHNGDAVTAGRQGSLEKTFFISHYFSDEVCLKACIKDRIVCNGSGLALQSIFVNFYTSFYRAMFAGCIVGIYHRHTISFHHGNGSPDSLRDGCFGGIVCIGCLEIAWLGFTFVFFAGKKAGCEQ